VCAGGPVIRGTAVPRPDKEALALALARELNLPAPPSLSEGSTVESEFLGRVYRAIAGRDAVGTAYRKTEAILAHLGRTYDGSWDTSENAPTGGGSTVTVRAYSQMLSAYTGRDRCFIVPRAERRPIDRLDLPVGGIRHQKLIAEAGPGARLIFCESRRREAPRLTGTATVRYVRGSARGAPWEVDLYRRRAFRAIQATDVDIAGWDPDAVTEIYWDTYHAILGVAFPDGRPHVIDHVEVDADVIEQEVTADPGGRETARRALDAFDPSVEHQALRIPVLPTGSIQAVPPRQPDYIDDGERLRAAKGDRLPRRSQRDPDRDRSAEIIAIETTIKAFKDAGWVLSADRQADGVGYDLDFSMDGETLHVEVKGIIGPDLAFNLTAKENWRAENDPKWVVAAVTSVLTPGARRINLLSRDQVVAGSRVITSYRVTL